MFQCRACGKDTEDKKNNASYCNPCGKLMAKSCRVWRAGDVWIWVRQGTVKRVVYKDKNIQPVFIRREIMEG